jgi:hypothetical protein
MGGAHSRDHGHGTNADQGGGAEEYLLVERRLPLDVLHVMVEHMDSRTAGRFAQCSHGCARAVKEVRHRRVVIDGEHVELFAHEGNLYIDLQQPLSWRQPIEHINSYRNFSSCRQAGHNITTIWYKLRFDPHTMKVHTGDTTFARSVGEWVQAGGARVTYGMAYCCDGGSNRNVYQVVVMLTPACLQGLSMAGRTLICEARPFL